MCIKGSRRLLTYTKIRDLTTNNKSGADVALSEEMAAKMNVSEDTTQAIEPKKRYIANDLNSFRKQVSNLQVLHISSRRL